MHTSGSSQMLRPNPGIRRRPISAELGMLVRHHGTHDMPGHCKRLHGGLASDLRSVPCHISRLVSVDRRAHPAPALLTATDVAAWLSQLSASRVSSASCVAILPPPLGAIYMGQQRRQPHSGQPSMCGTASKFLGCLAEPALLRRTG